MMKKGKTKILLTQILIMSLILFTSIRSNNVSAAIIKTKGYYNGGNSKIAATHFGNRIKKVVYKKNTVVFSGGLYHYTVVDGCNYNPSVIKNKKMQFVISSKCKYYKGYYFSKTKSVSKKKFMKATSPIKKNVGIAFKVKKGKIVEMYYGTNWGF